jgi:hypothetical protein
MCRGHAAAAQRGHAAQAVDGLQRQAGGAGHRGIAAHAGTLEGGVEVAVFGPMQAQKVGRAARMQFVQHAERALRQHAAVGDLRGCRLAGCGQLFGGIQPRRFRQPEARRIARLVLQQRAVEQRVDGVQRRPFVEVIVGHHLLCRLEPEAAAEDREPAQRRLLHGVEQRTAPVEHGAQALLARRPQRRAAVQQAQPFGQALVQCREPQLWRAGGGELDRQRVAVQVPAELGGARQAGGIEHEALVSGARALHEQRHRRAGGDGVGRGVGRRQRQGAQAPDLLARQVQRHLRGDEHAQARGRRQPRRQHRGESGHQVLGVVQHQQQLPRRQAARQQRGGVAFAQWCVHGMGHRQRHGAGLRRGFVFRQRRQVDPGDTIGPGVAVPQRERARQHRLAQATGADDADQVLRGQQFAQRGQVGIAAQQRRGVDRQRRGCSMPVRRRRAGGRARIRPHRPAA